MVTAAAVGVRSGGKVTQTLGRLAIAGVIAYVCIDVLLALTSRRSRRSSARTETASTLLGTGATKGT